MSRFTITQWEQAIATRDVLESCGIAGCLLLDPQLDLDGIRFDDYAHVGEVKLGRLREWCSSNLREYVGVACQWQSTFGGRVVQGSAIAGLAAAISASMGIHAGLATALAKIFLSSGLSTFCAKLKPTPYAGSGLWCIATYGETGINVLAEIQGAFKIDVFAELSFSIDTPSAIVAAKGWTAPVTWGFSTPERSRGVFLPQVATQLATLVRLNPEGDSHFDFADAKSKVRVTGKIHSNTVGPTPASNGVISFSGPGLACHPRASAPA